MWVKPTLREINYELLVGGGLKHRAIHPVSGGGKLTRNISLIKMRQMQETLQN